MTEHYDVIIVGAGVSGSFLASVLTQGPRRILIIEAGRRFDSSTYPRSDLDGNSQLYWSGGIELNEDADIGLLRPKVVGGGSIVNQALLDRFDDDALESWKKRSGVSFFTSGDLAPWYEKAESSFSLQSIPEAHWNRNARIFREGFEKNGFSCAPLRRAQKDCRYADGNDCIECLNGCRIDSKQSTPVTVLKKAMASGRLELLSETEALEVLEQDDRVGVLTRSKDGLEARYLADKLVLASGAIGNSKLLLRSRIADDYPALGKGFFTHPQYMSLAVYDEPVNAHKGPFQALKSTDPGFRSQGFKLENVFAPPAGVAMLIPGFGSSHHELMEKLGNMACIEVAIRDTEPGEIRLSRGGQLRVMKRLNSEDRARRVRGLEAVDRIFSSTGARRVIRGDIAIGLHLMGGCAIGTDRRTSVVSPDFHLHGRPDICVADSSIFPDAPGINPSLTIMALSLKAAEVIAQ